MNMNLQKYSIRKKICEIFIVTCIIFATVIFSVIAFNMLSLSQRFNILFNDTIKTFSNNPLNSNIGENVNYLTTLSEINNNSYNNNIFSLLYVLISLILSGVAGFIFKQGLDNKKEVSLIISNYNKTIATYENTLNKKNHYDSLNVDLDTCSDLLLLVLVQDNNNDDLVSYIVKLRQSINQYYKQIVKLNFEYNRTSPLNTSKQVEIIYYKTHRVIFAMEKGKYTNKEIFSINLLKETLAIIQGWSNTKFY